MKTTVPAVKCPNPNCGRVWVPKGRKGPKRCPGCWRIVEIKA